MFKKRALTGWMIALINVSAISNIKNFPLLAEAGLSIISYLFLVCVFFFIPVALVSAELASAWPERGIYTWVREAFGARLGFLAIWLEWIENVIWYPTILSFIVASLAYTINPALAYHKGFMMGSILLVFWSATWVNFLGMTVSGWISSVAALVGAMFPIALIIFFGGLWVSNGYPVQIQTDAPLLPDFTSPSHMALFSGILLTFCGLEMSAVHAKEVKDPQKSYPKGIFLSTFLIMSFSVLGALAIASIVPHDQIGLASGSMEAFSRVFHAFGIPWALPVIALIATFGALGMMSTWIVGPSKGLHGAAEYGDLPPIFHKTNAHGMPVNILIFQGLIVTALCAVFFFLPSVNSTYWILSVLASLLYMLMYILMFAAAIRLRYKFPNQPRVYKIPYGSFGIWATCLLGAFGSLFGVITSFLPPEHIDGSSFFFFETFLIVSTIVFCALPILIFACRKPHWHKLH